MVQGATSEAVWAKIIGTHNDCAGRELKVLQDVYKSESDTNQRNQAIGMLMYAYGYIKAKPEQAVDLYTRQCSIGVNAKDLAWVTGKLTLQPNGVVLQPIRLTGARETIAKKTYIRAPSYPQKAFDKAFEECKADPSWRTFVAENSGHDVMIDQPAWLVDILLQAS